MSTLLRFAVHLFSATACVGFGLSVLVNVLSYLPFAPPAYGAFMLLHLGIFALVLPYILVYSTDPEVKRLSGGRWFISRTSKRGQQIQAAAIRYAPAWARKLQIVIMVYFFVTFLAHLILFAGSINTNFLLTLRLFSSGWIGVYWYFWMIFYSRMRHMALTDEKPHTDLPNPGIN